MIANIFFVMFKSSAKQTYIVMIATIKANAYTDDRHRRIKLCGLYGVQLALDLPGTHASIFVSHFIYSLQHVGSFCYRFITQPVLDI